MTAVPVVAIRRSPASTETHLQETLGTTYCGLSFTSPVVVPGFVYISCTPCIVLLRRAQHRSPYDDPLTPYDEDDDG